MRACFLGQNICALGFGVAMVQSPRLDEAGGVPAEDPSDIPPALENRMVWDLKRAGTSGMPNKRGPIIGDNFQPVDITATDASPMVAARFTGDICPCSEGTDP
jgi:hypothetical protein